MLCPKNSFGEVTWLWALAAAARTISGTSARLDKRERRDIKPPTVGCGGGIATALWVLGEWVLVIRGWRVGIGCWSPPTTSYRPTASHEQPLTYHVLAEFGRG